MPETSDKGKRGGKVIVTISVIVIIASLLVIGMSLFTLLRGSHAGYTGESPVNVTASGEQQGGETASAVPDDLETETSVLVAYPISTAASKTLSFVYVLVECMPNENYEALPAYIFIGQKNSSAAVGKGTVNEDNTLSEDAATYVAAVNEISNLALNLTTKWDMPYAEYLNYMKACQYVQTEQYIILIADAKYEAIIKEFEKAVTDPTVLDFEDLISRLSETDYNF